MVSPFPPDDVLLGGSHTACGLVLEPRSIAIVKIVVSYQVVTVGPPTSVSGGLGPCTLSGISQTPWGFPMKASKNFSYIHTLSKPYASSFGPSIPGLLSVSMRPFESRTDKNRQFFIKNLATSDTFRARDTLLLEERQGKLRVGDILNLHIHKVTNGN